MAKRSTIEVSSLFRSNVIVLVDFLKDIQFFFNHRKKCINHFVVVDFDNDILAFNNVVQEFLNNSLLNEYISGSRFVTGTP